MQQETEQMSAGEGALVTMRFSPAHQADLMVGHGKGDCLLIDPSRVAVELGCDIYATGDGPPGMYLRLELVHLGDLHHHGLQAHHVRSRHVGNKSICLSYAQKCSPVI